MKVTSGKEYRRWVDDNGKDQAMGRCEAAVRRDSLLASEGGESRPIKVTFSFTPLERHLLRPETPIPYEPDLVEIHICQNLSDDNEVDDDDDGVVFLMRLPFFLLLNPARKRMR